MGVRVEKEIEIAKQIITEVIKKCGLEIKKFFLFGSRARGDSGEDSDWDFFVVIDKDIDISEKRESTARIRIKLAQEKIPADIIIQSFSVAEKRKKDVGYLTYYVMKEGVQI